MGGGFRLRALLAVLLARSGGGWHPGALPLARHVGRARAPVVVSRQGALFNTEAERLPPELVRGGIVGDGTRGLAVVAERGSVITVDRPRRPLLNATELYAQAKRYSQTRCHADAIAILKQLAFDLTPDDGKVWMKLATEYKRTRRLSDAEDALEQGIKACPTNAILRQALADFCREGKRYSEARGHFRRAMRLDPDLASVYDSWGRMESSCGHHKLAASLFERGLSLRPTARLHHALGVLLDTLGHADRARRALKKGLSLPNEAENPQLLHALGMVEVRAGNVQRARSHFLGAIESRPSFTKAYLALGQLEERLGNKQAARRHYEAGATTPHASHQGGAVQLWQSWARMEQRLGRPSSALRLYRRAAHLFPEDQKLQIEWAKLAAECGDEEAARSLFRDLTSARRASPYSFQCAAAFEAKQGEADAARRLYERGAELAAAAAERAERAERASGGAAAGGSGGGSAGVDIAEEYVPLLHAHAVFEWRQGDRIAAERLFERAEDAASAQPCGWLFQWRARFEAEANRTEVARHYYARAVNAAPQDVTAWRMWAEYEASIGHEERAATLSKHALVIETEATVVVAEGTPRVRNPLGRRWGG